MTEKHVRDTGAKHLAWVASESDAETEYEIARLPDRRLKCACLGYAFSKKTPKTCKHIEAMHLDVAQRPADTVPTGRWQPPPPKRSVAVRGEVLTVRRAMAFGDDFPF